MHHMPMETHACAGPDAAGPTPGDVAPELIVAVTAVVARSARLTPREHQALRELLAGQANKDIAARLGCSVKTVETYLTNVMRKTRTASRLALVSESWLAWAASVRRPGPRPLGRALFT